MAGKQWMKTRPGRVVLAALGWTILGCVFALPDLSRGTEWRRALLLSLTLWWSWGIVTPLILWVDRQIPVPNKQLARRILSHLIPSLMATSAYVYVLGAVRAAAGIAAWNGLPRIGVLVDSLRNLFVWNWLIYWLILGAWQAYRYYDHYVAGELRLERLERQFSEARLNALRMQLDPHFLFNALNAVSSQVERDPKLARRMIEHLGDLLRMSLESKDRQEVPLAEELAFLEHYLAIQKIRFGERLRIEIGIAPETKFASVPCLLLQPLVENAIRHGISKRSSGGTIVVSAKRVGETLEVHVLDDGVGLPRQWSLENSGGVGLAVTRQRIAALHPNGASRFVVRDRECGGTEVEIALPFNLMGEAIRDPSPA
jgi:hypothetical protein